MKTEWGWVRRSSQRQRPAGRRRGEKRVAEEARGGGVAWPPPSSSQKQKLLLDSITACTCTRMCTRMHLCVASLPWPGLGFTKVLTHLTIAKGMWQVSGKETADSSWPAVVICF